MSIGYVDDVKNDTILQNTLTLEVTADVKVEARYTEAFKMIFSGTPFVKYADRNGYIFLGGNFYHFTGPKNGAYGTSVSSWKGDNNKTYNVDNVPNDTTVVRDTLTADVVLTPVYQDNGNDLGDASATAVWSFAYSDSVALFRQFSGKCNLVQSTDFNAAFTDVNMVVDATEGMIDNELLQGKGYSFVKAGTKFRLPMVYGTIFTLCGSNEFSATTIDGEVGEKGMEGEFHTTSLTFTDPMKDSIDIVIGEDQNLKYIRAEYPGGHTTLNWATNLRTAESTIGTASKTGQGGCIVVGMTDIENVGGLEITPVVCDTLTSQIQATIEKDSEKYMSVGFDVGKGFAFNLNTVSVPLALIGMGTTGKVELYIEDEFGHKLDSIFTNLKTDSLLTCTMTGPKKTATSTNTIYQQGHVTVKIWVYGADAKYAFGSPIAVAGVICEEITCGPGKNWALHVSKGAVDLEKLVGLHTYEVVGVNEKQLTIIKVPLEEGKQATTLLINTEKAGEVFYTPLTRADDAIASAENILFVSDGTVAGNKMRYVFKSEGDLYYFQMVPEGELIPEGEIYLEWDSFTYPETLYMSKEDIPTGILDIDMNEMLANGQTRRVVKNGEVLIIKPDGKVYNMMGIRIF